jgi:vacuolar protein sorting-associated protein IST1
MQIHRSKRSNETGALRKEVAILLSKGKSESARIKVERVIQNDYYCEALELLDMYCDLVHARVLLLDGPTNNVPPDMNEAVCTLVWAAPRTEVEELSKFRNFIGAKFGPGMIHHVDSNPAACVNARVLFKLSVVIPERALVTQYLTAIAEENGVDWSPEEPSAKDIPNPYLEPSSMAPVADGPYAKSSASCGNPPIGGSSAPISGQALSNPPSAAPVPTAPQEQPAAASPPHAAANEDEEFDELARRFQSLKKKSG